MERAARLSQWRAFTWMAPSLRSAAFRIMNALFPVGNAHLVVDEAYTMGLLFAWTLWDAGAGGPRTLLVVNVR